MVAKRPAPLHGGIGGVGHVGCALTGGDAVVVVVQIVLASVGDPHRPGPRAAGIVHVPQVPRRMRGVGAGEIEVATVERESGCIEVVAVGETGDTVGHVLRRGPRAAVIGGDAHVGAGVVAGSAARIFLRGEGDVDFALRGHDRGRPFAAEGRDSTGPPPGPRSIACPDADRIVPRPRVVGPGGIEPSGARIKGQGRLILLDQLQGRLGRERTCDPGARLVGRDGDADRHIAAGRIKARGQHIGVVTIGRQGQRHVPGR